MVRIGVMKFADATQVIMTMKILPETVLDAFELAKNGIPCLFLNNYYF